ncbi:hypothetical protein [Streptomyces erythrochromogenes]|uniref:hypothetical protein n=1 Tax=Streptomyces erythrochromogenes TaxID=285574 RepID=UPI003413F064
MSALDGAERLRQPARLPRPDGVLDNNLGFGQVTSWVASPVWTVDHLLRLGGIHTCPPPRSSAILYASLHGGLAANIGYLHTHTGTWTDWQKKDSPFESAAEAETTPQSVTYIPRLKPVNRRTDGLWLEFWANTQGHMVTDSIVRLSITWLANGGTRHFTIMEVNFTTGKLTAWNGTNIDHTKNQALQWTHTPLQTWGTFHVGWWLTWSTSGVPTIAPVITDSSNKPVVFSDAVLSTTPCPPGNFEDVRLTLQNLRAEAYQISQLASKPSGYAAVTQTGSWKRGATLDIPTLPMETIPQAQGSAWEMITQIARATLATAEFDSNGYFRWRDYSRWATPPTQPNLTVSSVRELAGLELSEEIDACRNHVAVKWANWSRVVGDNVATVGENRPGTAIAAGATLTRTFTIGEDQWDPRTPNTYVDPMTDCVSIRATADSASAGVYGAVEVTLLRDGGTVTLTMRNRASTTVYYHGVTALARTTASGSPSGPADALATVQNRTSQTAHGVQTYEHQGAGWIQYRETALELANAILSAGAYPIPALQSVEILPDPRLELGDVVRVVDTTGAALDTLAWVVGIKASGEGGRIVQSLALRGTRANGVPADTGLTPDPPVNPDAPPP